jgi:hypothetical protein
MQVLGPYVNSQPRPEQIQTALDTLNIFGLECRFELLENSINPVMVLRQ